MHVHNGDCSALILRQSGLAGEHLVWRDSLITGPTPLGLKTEEWRRVRALALASAFGLDVESCHEGLTRQERDLENFQGHDEIVLWFEHDLFCQTILIYLLDWFSRKDLGNTRLSVLCVGEFPSVADFRGFGNLTPDQMASFFDKRRGSQSHSEGAGRQCLESLLLFQPERD